MSKPFSIALPHRGLIHIEGEDRASFLQGLVSNDVEKAAPDSILYACLLTPQGKFLHDFFIHAGDGFFLLDCEGGERAKDLYERLSRFRLRAKVKISYEESHPVHAVFGHDAGLPDPRHPDLGRRAFEKPDGLGEEAFEVWDKKRIALCIPDGSRDMELERSTLLEARLDALNGIDWNKGCYMGQELTARMHYRGLAKKHLYSVAIDGDAPPPFSALPNGGQMRSSCGAIGLALLKDEKLHETDYGAIKPL
ncbi:MAG: folate-binding protein [Micavibrio sp.]